MPLHRRLRANRPLLLGTAAIGLAFLAASAVISPSAAYTSNITRAPYLSDLTSTGVKVNFGTARGIVKVRARYAPVSGGSCALTPLSGGSVTVGTTVKIVYTITYPTSSATATASSYQWKVQLSGLATGSYCYRIEGASTPTTTSYTDLLGSATASPTFKMSPANTFAVIGDWGQTGSAGSTNQYQANVISGLAKSQAQFAVSTGDIGYPSGNQSNYGDLAHTGSDISSVFGPRYWPVAGKSIPMMPVPGNHGFTSTFSKLWPSSSLAADSGGKAADGTYLVDGSTLTVPNYWFAKNVNGWRIYFLTAAWSNTVTAGNTPYAEDYKQHWAPGAAERTWLTNDLRAHAATPKIAIFHYPLYSAVAVGDIADKYLTAPTDGSQSVENLLATNKVKLVLNGHSHIYQRSYPHHGLVSIVSGGGGAGLSTIAAAQCSQVYKDTGQPVVAFARGWGPSGGSACHTAKPTSAANVYHFLKITLTTSTATVAAIDSTGATFDATSIS